MGGLFEVIDPQLFDGALKQAVADLENARANVLAADANVVKATIEALRSLRRRDEILKARGIRASAPSNGEEAPAQS